MQRAEDKTYLVPMAQSELDAIAERNTRKWFAAKVLDEAESQIRNWYQAHSKSIRRMARAFLPEHIERFESQFPRYNLTEIFGINPKSGLSNYLSCHPDDPKYLKPLEVDNEGMPVRSKDGSMTAALRLMLSLNPVIPSVRPQPSKDHNLSLFLAYVMP
jgi:hypothetical protein